MEENSGVSNKSRGTALALCAVIGVTGAHRFYVGKSITGCLQLCTIGGLGFWWLYDMILIASGGFRDADDRRVSQWAESDAPPGLKGSKDARIAMLMEEMDIQRGEIADVQERVDFVERMLAQVKDRAILPPG